MDHSLIKKIIEEAVEPNPSLFVVDWSISASNQIDVFIDSDNGVDLEEIIRVSRYIEHHQSLDREVEDFALSVSTPGATSPIRHPRQYNKNIGRSLEVKLTDGQVLKGELTQVTPDGITIQWTSREPKPIGKGKINVTKEAKIAFLQIKQAKVVISFNE